MLRVLSTILFVLFVLIHAAAAPVMAAGLTVETGETSRKATFVSENGGTAGNSGIWQQQKNVAPDADLPRLSTCPDHCVWLVQALEPLSRAVSSLRALAGSPSPAPVPFEVSLPPPQ